MASKLFWDLSGFDGVALVGPDGVVDYGALAGRVAEMAGRLDAGRGIVRLEMTPSFETIAMYLAALGQGCPVLPAGPGEDTLPILYRYDPKTDVLETNLAAQGTDLHPDLRLLLSTSGSTGAQKYVRLSGENITSNATAIATYLGLTAKDRAPTALPLSYSYGLSVLNSHLAVGASLVLTDAPVVSNTFWTRFADTGCTSFAGVPQSFTLLMKGGQLDRDYPALRYVTQAGGKLGPDAVRTMAALGEKHGWDFFVMYGQTEAAPRIAYLPPDKAQAHPEAIGRAIPGGTLMIEGPDGPLPPGEEGELVYEGPNVMMGYATGPADLGLGQGARRLKTGDLGYQTDDGLFVITGRSSRFLKLSGKRVSLDEIEAWAAREGTPVIATGEDDALGLLHTGNDTDLARKTATFLDIPQAFVTDIPLDKLPLNQNNKPDIKAAKAIFKAQSEKQKAQPITEQAGMQAIWAEVLGLKTVPTEKSFYDLGGDSIAAFNAILKMEAMGLDPDLVRGILNGRTIDDLTRPIAGQQVTETQTLSLTEMINAVHGLRGFLAVWVVMVHWLPALANRLGANALYEALYPAWRYGTPGFAMAFGIGIGALKLHQDSSMTRASAWLGAKWVIGGVATLAFIRWAMRVTDDDPWDKFDLSFMFHNALFYYAIAMLALPFMVRVLSIGPNRLVTILLACAAVTMAQTMLYAPLGLARPDAAVLELIKVMTFGKFGFLRMTGYVLVGVTIGWLVRQHYARPGFARDLALTGLATAGLGAAAQYQFAPDNLSAGFVLPTLWQVALFAGVSLMLLAGFTWIVRLRGALGGRLRQLVIVTGILAFPIFVGHSVIGGLKELADNLGLPGSLTLPALLGLFGLGLGYGYWRLGRFYR